VPAPESIRRAYHEAIPIADSIREYVRSTLQPYCDEHRYLFFDRIKDLDSLSEKIESGRTKAWSDLDDTYAATVVVPTTRHEPAVLEFLGEVFEKQQVRSRDTAMKAPDVFRFDTTRFYGTVTEAAAAERIPGMGEFIFEIQIPTVFEYAWITVTHDLVYKSGEVDWRRLRLAAQLKAVVEQAELIIESFERVKDSVPESAWPEVESKTQIVAKFKELMKAGYIRTELAPISWNRFADNVYALVCKYTENPRARQSAVLNLLSGMEAYVTDPDAPACPASGSLFQLVLGYVGRNDTVGSLDKFVVVESEELAVLYGVGNIAKPFQFG